MSDLPPPEDRLDSWKSIADYLQRDVATVRRWEKTLGLPVRRVAGSGRSVFANRAEIDAWLQTEKAIPLAAPVALSAPATVRRFHLRWVVLILAILAMTGVFLARQPEPTADDLRVEATSDGLIARTSRGVEEWRHQFPATYKTVILPGSVQVTNGTSPGVYFASSFRASRTEDHVESGELTFLDLAGNKQRSFSFTDQVTFQGRSFGPPWAVSAFAIDDAAGTRRVAVSGHHYVWDPSIVTILDERWQRHGTFVYAGWIEAVRWLRPDRLVIAGFSNAQDAGMMALLDVAALDGQGPEDAGSRHFCDACGTDRPLRMFAFPRTELNRVTASPFNRVVVQTMTDRIIARTIEMPSSGGDADAVYEFNSSLDLVNATFSERYWELHRALEREGKIAHTRQQCPDRDGPRQVRMWEPATGWRPIK
jgi:hypothetical protein